METFEFYGKTYEKITLAEAEGRGIKTNNNCAGCALIEVDCGDINCYLPHSIFVELPAPVRTTPTAPDHRHAWLPSKGQTVNIPFTVSMVHDGTVYLTSETGAEIRLSSKQYEKL